MSTGKCKICLEEKSKNYIGLTKHQSAIYHDDKGKKWLGKVCPECIKVFFKQRREPHKKDYPEIPCGVCQTPFKPKNKIQKLCDNKVCKNKRKNAIRTETPESLASSEMKNDE